MKRKSVTKKHKARDSRYNHWHWKSNKNVIINSSWATTGGGGARSVVHPWRDESDLHLLANEYNTYGHLEEESVENLDANLRRPSVNSCSVHWCDSLSCMYIKK